MIFKIQIISASDDSVKTVYRKLWFFSNLGSDIDDCAVPSKNTAFFQEYTVYWIDEHSHRVEINSQKDYDCMFEKVKNVPTPVLYLEERKFSSLKSRALGKSWGFVCSHCKIQKIAGFGYKCLECEDYRLCSDCEAGKAHKEHVILRFDSLEKETSFMEKFSIKKKIYCEPEVTDRILVNLMLSKMISSNATLQPTASAPPEYNEKECNEEKSTSGRSRRFSDATTFGWNDDADPVAALTALFDRFRETISQVEGKLLTPNQLEDFEKDLDTKIAGGKQIKKAVKELTDMGYKNNGNWLAHLLLAADGDINKALDLLKPGKCIDLHPHNLSEKKLNFLLLMTD